MSYLILKPQPLQGSAHLQDAVMTFSSRHLLKSRSLQGVQADVESCEACSFEGGEIAGKGDAVCCHCKRCKTRKLA